jgi:hypothetical protein
MDIRYVDHDPLSRLKPIDNTSYATEDERITKKRHQRLRFSNHRLLLRGQ